MEINETNPGKIARQKAWADGLVVWQETTWPFQWIGMCPRHSGGIRANDKSAAQSFMDELCEHQRCLNSKAE